LDQENATSTGGASIEDRLVSYLSAGEKPQEPKEPPQGDVKAEADTTPDTAEQGQRDTDDGGNEPSDEPQVTTSDLAKILGIDESALDVDDDGAIKLKTKIDGAEGTAKLADLLKSYQLEGHVNKRSMEIAEREKALQTRAQEVEQQAQQRLQNVESLNNVAKQELLQEYQSINWQALEQQDAGQAALLKQKFQERMNRLQGVEQYIGQERQKHFAKLDGDRQRMVSEESQKLVDAIPEWKDAQVRDKEINEIVRLAESKGVPSHLLSILSQGLVTPQGVIPPSAGLIAIIRDGLKQRELQQSKPAIENKVRLAPKIVKPGQAKTDTKAEQLRSLKQNVIKSGGKNGSIEEFLIRTGKV
jgi:hypothetical protein